MLKIFDSIKAIGLELTSNQIKGATVFLKNGQPVIEELWSVELPISQIKHVKQLYTNHPIVSTGLDGSDVLIRNLTLPLTKEKDIDAALAFQAEPLLPYSSEHAILGKQLEEKTNESSTLKLFSTTKDCLQKHLDIWNNLKIEPEKISCTPLALCHFARSYFKTEKPFLVAHLSGQRLVCVLIKNGKLVSSYTHLDGLETIESAFRSEGSSPFTEIDFLNLQNDYPKTHEATIRLQQALAKMCFSLAKECRGESLEGILLTGEASLLTHFYEKLIEKLQLPLLEPADENGHSFKNLCSFAVPIGLAIGSLTDSVDFRQNEYRYPHPWKRLQKPVGAYFSFIFILCLAIYFFGQIYLKYENVQIKQQYVDLLASMNKTHEQFEQLYLAKNSAAREKNNNEIIPIEFLSQDDLQQRIDYLYKDLQISPDSFPLYPNIPRVSDVLAWLSNHPQIVHNNADGTVEERLQIENFNYNMTKRPTQGKKQEKYAVKIELELSSPTPKWAREFHDALIANNDFVDPKGEIKWSSNRGHYKTSFYLKDKTSYNY